MAGENPNNPSPAISGPTPPLAPTPNSSHPDQKETNKPNKESLWEQRVRETNEENKRWTAKDAAHNLGVKVFSRRARKLTKEIKKLDKDASNIQKEISKKEKEVRRKRIIALNEIGIYYCCCSCGCSSPGFLITILTFFINSDFLNRIIDWWIEKNPKEIDTLAVAEFREEKEKLKELKKKKSEIIKTMDKRRKELSNIFRLIKSKEDEENE